MERTISVEEKIKRAEEIYARRQGNSYNKTATSTVTISNNTRKDIKLLKKMLIQIAVCTVIYLVVYTISNNNYFFSEVFINQTKSILSYDINFQELYANVKQNVEKGINNLNNNNMGIGGANENKIENSTNDKNTIENKVEEKQNSKENTSKDKTENNTTENTKKESNNKKLTQAEKNIQAIQKTTSFIKPLNGTISSKYGQRKPTTRNVPKNHTGVDIAANTGTKIVSATDGEVVLKSNKGDYGKHLKIQIGKVSIIYAHCSKLCVKQGDKVKQGQKIAEVGSTGNSTGPHLHFEIRYNEQTIDPQKILKL